MDLVTGDFFQQLKQAPRYNMHYYSIYCILQVQFLKESKFFSLLASDDPEILLLIWSSVEKYYAAICDEPEADQVNQQLTSEILRTYFHQGPQVQQLQRYHVANRDIDIEPENEELAFQFVRELAKFLKSPWSDDMALACEILPAIFHLLESVPFSNNHPFDWLFNACAEQFTQEVESKNPASLTSVSFCLGMLLYFPSCPYEPALMDSLVQQLISVIQHPEFLSEHVINLLAHLLECHVVKKDNQSILAKLHQLVPYLLDLVQSASLHYLVIAGAFRIIFKLAGLENAKFSDKTFQVLEQVYNSGLPHQAKADVLNNIELRFFPYSEHINLVKMICKTRVDNDDKTSYHASEAWIRGAVRILEQYLELYQSKDELLQILLPLFEFFPVSYHYLYLQKLAS